MPQPVTVSADLIKAAAEVSAVQVEGRGLARCIRAPWVSEERSWEIEGGGSQRLCALQHGQCVEHWYFRLLKGSGAGDLKKTGSGLSWRVCSIQTG